MYEARTGAGAVVERNDEVQAGRILVVDDDAHIRSVVRFALESAGLRVREAADGETALRLCAEEAPALLLLDIMMPGIDGMLSRRLSPSRINMG